MPHAENFWACPDSNEAAPGDQQQSLVLSTVKYPVSSLYSNLAFHYLPQSCAIQNVNPSSRCGASVTTVIVAAIARHILIFHTFASHISYVNPSITYANTVFHTQTPILQKQTTCFCTNSICHTNCHNFIHKPHI